MNILITGGAGFIGSHTAVSLHEAGHVPILLDNFSNSNPNVIDGVTEIISTRPKLYTGDCRNTALIEQVLHTESISGIIHFAAFKSVGESVHNPLKYYENNILSLLAVLQAMRACSVQNILFSSSATVYGRTENFPVTEEHPIQQAENPYGNTKQIAEEILRDTVNSGAFPLRSIALRYFNPIGAHPSAKIGELPIGTPANLVPYLTQATAKKRAPLTVFGNNYDTKDGTCIRDYIHIMDLAEAHVAAMEYLEKRKEKNVFDIFNVGTGKGTSVLEVISSFEKATGETVPYHVGDRRPGDVPKSWASAKKIERATGWKAKRSLKEALLSAWKWETSQKNRETASCSISPSTNIL